MRLRSLRLEKFGHFEDTETRFGPGLTVVYGANEAGKSTLLDGLGGFLWGVHPKNSRAFKYTPGQAQLTGSVESGDISVTMVRRLKKLSIDGVEQVPLWGQATPATDAEWRQTFGMDRARLRQGGRQIIAGGGDLADLIAMAETGEAISRVLEALQARSEAIYKERKGAVCEVRETTTAISRLTEQIGEREASAADVARLQDQIAALEARKSELQAALTRARREQRALEELRRCFEPAARLRDAEDLLTRVRGEGTTLDQAGTARLAKALAGLESATDRVADLEAQVARASHRRTSHTLAPELLGAEADIAALRGQIEARKADRRTVEGVDDLARLERAVEDAIRRLGRTSEGDLLEAASGLLLGEQVADQLTRYARLMLDAQRAADEKQAAVQRLAREGREAEAADIDDVGEREVVEARQRRDQAWQRLRSPWLSGDLPESSERRSMAEIVDGGIAEADEVAQSRSDTLEALGRRRGEAAQRVRQLQQAGEELRAALTELEQATLRWAALVQQHSLPAGLDPEAWHIHARLLGDLAEAVRDVRAARDTREQAQRRLTTFERTVSELARLLPAAPADAIVTVQQLGSALDVARGAQEAVSEIDRQIAELQEEIAGLVRARDDAKQEIGLVMGDIDEPAGEVRDRSIRVHRAEDGVASAAAILQEAKNPESDIAAVRDAVAAADIVSLQNDADIVLQRVQEHESEHSALFLQIGAAQRELEQLTSRESVANLVAERVEHASRLVALVEEYQSLKVQIVLLRRYKQLLADTSDSTVLQRAGEVLSVLTAGRFHGFAVVEEEGQRRIDVLFRDPASPGQSQTSALSELSEGTADQVFLALRLAGIAVRQRQRAQAGLSLVPVVFDDVLMSHDDERSAAALRAMAQMGDQMQIIVLTHHRSVAEAAAAIEGVHLSELPSVPQPVGVPAG